MSLEGGVKGYLRTMKSELSDPSDVSDLSDLSDFTQVMNTNYFTVYATPKFEYWVKRVNLTPRCTVSFAHYTFDKALANRSEVYFSPSMSMNWKPNNRFSLTMRGGTGRSPMNLNMIHPGYIMTDYRTFKQGVENFYNSSSQRVSAAISYKHTRRGLFANAVVMQSWSHLPIPWRNSCMATI